MDSKKRIFKQSVLISTIIISLLISGLLIIINKIYNQSKNLEKMMVEMKRIDSYIMIKMDNIYSLLEIAKEDLEYGTSINEEYDN